MNLILLILNLILVLAFAAGLLSGSGIRSRPAYLLAAFVVAAADIVLVLELAGLLALVIPAAVLILQVGLTAVSALIWFRAGRPPLLGPFADFRLRQYLNLRPPGSPRRIWMLLLLTSLVAGALYAYLRSAELIVLLPPSNYDSLTYHLSRVGYWLQYHSYYPWPTPNLRQTTYPMNAELGLLWTILWWGTDQLAGFVQWISVPAAMLGIYALARLLGYPRAQSGMTALLWATLTQVLAQSSTTQNDLVSTACWVAALYFLFAGLRERRPAALILSAVAFGLAMGTKRTGFLVLPGLAVTVILILWLWRHQKDVWPSLRLWALACAGGFLLFGSYSIVQNVVAFGHPSLRLLNTFVENNPQATGDRPAGGLAAYPAQLRDNLWRYVYQLVDFSPLPLQLGSKINPFKAAFFGLLFRGIGIDVENPQTIGWSVSGPKYAFSLDYLNPSGADNSWFGPLTALLIPVMIYQLYHGVRARDPVRLSLGLIGIAYLAAVSADRRWDPASGRYFLIPVALCFPLLAGLLSTQTVWRAAVASAITAIALVSLSTVVSAGSGQIGWRSILSGTRRDPTWSNEYLFHLIQEDVPATASIGVVSYEDFRDYPLFGEGFARRVTLAAPEAADALPRTDLRRFSEDFLHSDFVLKVGGDYQTVPAQVSRMFSVVSDDGANALWIRNDLIASGDCDTVQWPFPDFFQSSSGLVCPKFPIVPGLTTGGFAHTIFLRDGRFVPVVSAGSQGQLQFRLLVQQPLQARFSIQAVPGEKNTPEVLRLDLVAGDSTTQSYSAGFADSKEVQFAVPLERGTYTVQVALAPGSTEATINRIQVSATP